MVNCVSKIFLSREDNAFFFILMLQFSSNNGRWGTRGGHCQWRGGGVDWSKSWLKPKLNCFTPAKAKVHLFVTRWKSCPSRTLRWPARRRGTSETRRKPNPSQPRWQNLNLYSRVQQVISSLRGDGIDPDQLLSRCRHLLPLLRKLFNTSHAEPFHQCLLYFPLSSVSSTLARFLQFWQPGRSESTSFYNKFQNLFELHHTPAILLIKTFWTLDITAYCHWLLLICFRMYRLKCSKAISGMDGYGLEIWTHLALLSAPLYFSKNMERFKEMRKPSKLLVKQFGPNNFFPDIVSWIAPKGR